MLQTINTHVPQRVLSVKYCATPAFTFALCMSGISNQGQLPKVGISGFQGDWNHRLVDLDCWNIDLLADLAEIIPVIV